MRIFAFHLLNDYSGSPKVLGQLIKGWVKNDLEVHLVTSFEQEGFLSNISEINTHSLPYRFVKNPFLRLFLLFWSQIFIVFKLYFKVKKSDTIYINTVLPFGACLLGKLKGCRVIYHLHETSIKPKILKWFLFSWIKYFADDVVYVSRFLSKQEVFKRPKIHILYNSLEERFWQKAQKNRQTNSNPKNILMVCSLKVYKGIWEFVHLAQDGPFFQFRLVLNASQQDIDAFFNEKTLPDNLELFSTQTDLHPFYQWADVLVNLSRPDGWVETFGLTVLEGMSYALPVIVPPTGGVVELVECEKNGFLVDARKRKKLNEKLRHILYDSSLYKRMSSNSLQKAEGFRENIFWKHNLEILNQK